MKVSIIIAVYNSHKVVVRQIRHFKKMNLPDDVEIVFVDDGSDPPLNYATCGLKNFKILYTNDKRPWTQGLARNMGAKEARGEYLFFTDVDHIITKECIEEVRKFTGDKMVFPRYFGIMDRRGNLITDRKLLLKFGLDPKVRGGHFHGNTYAIKKSIFEEIGGYDSRYCTLGFHMGGKFNSEEATFNGKWKKLVREGKAQTDVVGPRIYHYPVSKFRTDKNNNPFGLFHGLSLEQKPQPMKK